VSDHEDAACGVGDILDLAGGIDISGEGFFDEARDASFEKRLGGGAVVGGGDGDADGVDADIEKFPNAGESAGLELVGDFGGAGLVGIDDSHECAAGEVVGVDAGMVAAHASHTDDPAAEFAAIKAITGRCHRSDSTSAGRRKGRIANGKQQIGGTGYVLARRKSERRGRGEKMRNAEGSVQSSEFREDKKRGEEKKMKRRGERKTERSGVGVHMLLHDCSKCYP